MSARGDGAPGARAPEDVDAPAPSQRAGGKSGESLVVDRPTEPVLLGSNPTGALPGAPVGVECASCHQSNHEGVRRCVFCGEPIAVGDPAAQPAAGVGSSATLSPGAARWSEGPDSADEPPPSTRVRASALEVGFDDLAAAAPIADPLIGVVVAERYRILEGLGRGGMGIVYKVEHTRIGKLLAMKLLTGELSRNPEVVRRFKHEALTSSKLSSPNTVQVFDFGVSEGLTYLVMELVAGEDLGRILRTTGPMSFGRLGKIIIQACTSLAEAHGKGIVHRDIKPENVMLIRARDGTDIAKVLDFGLAKLREGSELNDVTSQGAIVGTPYFMSPEQVRGDPVDPRSDIYALGALMYRALTGHYPFNGPTPMAVFTKHLTETPVPPIERAPEREIPAAVSAIVMKALAKSPSDRYQKVEELQAALVDEIRTLGTSSVDNLLDSGALRRLAKVAAQQQDASAVPGVTAPAAEIATRDEVEAYERKLRRQRYGAVAVAGVLAVAAASVGAKVLLARQPTFSGMELEPNNSAGDATLVPLGKTAIGYLGKRVDATHSDRDFYAFDVPAPGAGAAAGASVVRVRVGALPNMPMCTMLYRHGQSSALAQYCLGRPGRDLAIGQLALEPGRYLAAVLQDLDPYGAQATPFVHENVSDSYEFRVEQVDPDASREIEPNDQVASANVIAAGASRAALIGWSHDEDVYCAAPSASGALRWTVRDKVRAGGGVLEATPMRGPEEGAPVRVHGAAGGSATKTDVLSPWSSAPVRAQDGDAPRCLRLRLVVDPWTSERSSIVPSGGSEEYVVELEAAP